MLLYFVLGLSFLSSTWAIDYTLVPEGEGEDIVCAVIDKISTSGIFRDDGNMLRRIAYVESKFGADRNTYRKNYHGGIWQIDRIGFDDAVANGIHKNLDALWEEKIPKLLNKQKSEIKWEDLRKPLFSGVFARIRLYLVSASIPQYNKLDEQAKYWKKHYNSVSGKGNESDFVNRVEEMNKKFDSDCNVCSGRMNLAIVMDGSGSIGDRDYGFAKQAANNLIDTFSIEFVDVGYVLFSDETEVIFPLKSNLIRDQMKTKIDQSRYPYGSTQTNRGIEVAVELLEKTDNRTGVPEVMVIFTDGVPDSAPNAISAADHAKKSNITIFTVAIGSDINQDVLKQLASRESYVMSVTSYESLIEFAKKINSETCKVPQTPKIGEKVEKDKLDKSEKRFFIFPLPDEGITLKINTNMGETRGYYSYTVENPSSANNDGEFTDEVFIDPRMFTNNRIAKREAKNISSVYVTIEGRQDNNVYSLESSEGNHTSGASHSKSISVLLIVTSFILLSNF